MPIAFNYFSKLFEWQHQLSHLTIDVISEPKKNIQLMGCP